VSEVDTGLRKCPHGARVAMIALEGARTVIGSYRRIGFMGGCNAILNQEWPGILNCGLVCALVARASRCRKFRPKLALFTEIHLSVGLLSLGLEI
jgi:hypothetical protein